MEKILTAFCYTDIHNQQAMLDYPTTVRSSLVQAKDLAIAEFGLSDLAIVGGDNVSDYPHWNKSCALPKQYFLDLKAKMHACVAESAKGGKVNLKGKSASIEKEVAQSILDKPARAQSSSSLTKSKDEDHPAQ